MEKNILDAYRQMMKDEPSCADKLERAYAAEGISDPESLATLKKVREMTESEDEILKAWRERDEDLNEYMKVLYGQEQSSATVEYDPVDEIEEQAVPFVCRAYCPHCKGEVNTKGVSYPGIIYTCPQCHKSLRVYGEYPRIEYKTTDGQVMTGLRENPRIH